MRNHDPTNLLLLLTNNYHSLNIAFLINASILIVSAAVLWSHHQKIDDLQQAPAALSRLLGTKAAGYFTER